MTGTQPAKPQVVSSIPTTGDSSTIAVPISYEIIQLFSEGLYQSPQKAIEELVVNGFDAGARNVRIILPSKDDLNTLATESLFIVDDGAGMNGDGFQDLWRVAHSKKREISEVHVANNGNAKSPKDPPRKPIGQFGIGKLAAFVLAWQLTHISKQNGAIRVVTMNFRRLSDVHQWDSTADPITLEVFEIADVDARNIMRELEARDAEAWSMLFGEQSADSWTAAILSDFKDLFGKLSSGRLSWVLRTGLPRFSNFSVYIDSQKLESSKASIAPLFETRVGGRNQDPALDSFTQLDGIEATSTGIRIDGIDGEITGKAELFKDPLSRGKAENTGRSHGFFVSVRGRIINLDDELFGLSALSHGAWSRFSFLLVADGLHNHLLSSREGVKESAPIRLLRRYMHEKFNLCRNKWEEELDSQLRDLGLASIRGDASGRNVSGPLIGAVRTLFEDDRYESFYLDRIPESGAESGSQGEEIEDFPRLAEERPFATISSGKFGGQAPMARYSILDRSLKWNSEHPLIAHIASKSKNTDPVELVAAAEVITESMLIDDGIEPELVDHIMRQRDRALRVLVGERPPVAMRVLADLEYAYEDKDAFEKAVGRAFQVLGFGYNPGGGNRGGADGVLHASLGVHPTGTADFRIVYDAKTTDGTAVDVGKIDFTALADFAKSNGAAYGFFAAKKFSGESDALSAVSRRQQIINDFGLGNFKAILLTVSHLQKLVRLHLNFGVTLTMVRALFDECGSTSEIDDRLAQLHEQLSGGLDRAPLLDLLKGIEAAKTDINPVNLYHVRAKNENLSRYLDEALFSQIKAVNAVLGDDWITVEPLSHKVTLHSTADQIVAELHRSLEDQQAVV